MTTHDFRLLTVPVSLAAPMNPALPRPKPVLPSRRHPAALRRLARRRGIRTV
jgi:hypothetical protein